MVVVEFVAVVRPTRPAALERRHFVAVDGLGLRVSRHAAGNLLGARREAVDGATSEKDGSKAASVVAAIPSLKSYFIA